MSTTTSASPKEIPVPRAAVIRLMIVLGIAVTTGFVWLQAGHVIAPPGLRLLDALWKLFVCRCPTFHHLFLF